MSPGGLHKYSIDICFFKENMFFRLQYTYFYKGELFWGYGTFLIADYYVVILKQIIIK